MKKELTIKEEQDIQLEILSHFMNICEKEQLHFFFAYGTLLGAIREHGFIEWDDDVDLWMPRKDFDKFAEIYPKYKKDLYFLQNYITDPETVAPEIMRICVNGTYKWPEGCEKESFHTGLYFDIFPLDIGFGTAQDKADLEKCTELHSKLLQSLHKTSYGTIKGFLKGIKARTISRKKYSNSLVELIKSHNRADSNILLSFPASYAGLCRSYFDKSFFEETVYVPFENIQVPVPKKYDELLRYMYGDDYMTPAVTKPHRTIAYKTD